MRPPTPPRRVTVFNHDPGVRTTRLRVSPNQAARRVGLAIPNWTTVQLESGADDMEWLDEDYNPMVRVHNPQDGTSGWIYRINLQ